ncbi:MAG TPA: acylphosphatase [Anaerolineales bacterium]
MTDNNELQRVHVWVKGRVQNVGFRAHVQYSARQIGVTGWVRNVGDDTVEAVGEGKPEQLERLVEAMKRGPRGAQVDESNIEWQNATGEFKDFQMRRSL